MNPTELSSRLTWPSEGQAGVYSEEAGFVGTSGAQVPVPVASIAKVMAAYVVLRSHPLADGEEGPRIPVDRRAAAESDSDLESVVRLTEGRMLSQRKLLELALIPSGSNAARLLARWHSGDESAFVREMNEAAAALGMTRTAYADVCGIDPASRSTSRDQLELVRAAMEIPAFRAIVARFSTRLRGGGLLCNTNRLLIRPEVVGIKTGSTTPAGGNILWAVRAGRPGREHLVLGAVLHQKPGAHLAEARAAARGASLALISSLRRELLPPHRGRLGAARYAVRAVRMRILHGTGWLAYQGRFVWSRSTARILALRGRPARRPRPMLR
ncbi:D-alanyl-D-alanine carboxypeptidase family protein [Streptomyces sp. NPDC059918]|uniref:D-alanyl-D-alanine carboxypeptidase family protein n=1 Tax=unclassified Streptomyces TaxID=2593676 RepID=UPI00365E604A